jgi:hypothetical protein
MKKFGENVQIIAILTVIGVFISWLQLITFIFIIIALGNIKRANEYLNDLNLKDFRSKLITAILIRFVGTILLSITAVILVFSIIFPQILPYIILSGFPFDPNFIFNLIATIGVIFAIGMIITIIGGVFEMKAWDSLGDYFRKSEGQYPEWMLNEVINGTENLKTGALLYILSFLVITIIIGFFFQIFGYFKLAKLKDINLYYQQAPPPPKYEEGYEERVKTSGIRCPNCDTPLAGEESFCPHCGARIS